MREVNMYLCTYIYINLIVIINNKKFKINEKNFFKYFLIYYIYIYNLVFLVKSTQIIYICIYIYIYIQLLIKLRIEVK